MRDTVRDAVRFLLFAGAIGVDWLIAKGIVALLHMAIGR